MSNSQVLGIRGASLGVHAINSASCPCGMLAHFRSTRPHARRARPCAVSQGRQRRETPACCLCSRLPVQLGDRRMSKTFLQQTGSTFKDTKYRQRRKSLTGPGEQLPGWVLMEE